MTATKFNDILKARYGLDLLDGALNREHLEFVFEYYNEQRQSIRQVLGESALDQTHYTKAFLIAEAARVILREIAPKRINGKKKGA